MAATLLHLQARSAGAAARAPSHARRKALNCALPRGVARSQRLRVACDASKPSGVLDSVKTGVDRFLAVRRWGESRNAPDGRGVLGLGGELGVRAAKAPPPPALRAWLFRPPSVERRRFA